MADSDKSIYNLRYNQISSNLEAFGGGSPQWTLITLNNVDPQQVPVTRLINTTGPLQGGGNLTVDRTLSILQATNISDGYLSSVDWNTFNNKQPAGSYITALTGDGTAAGPGSVPLTLATVNGSVGTFSYASITVNGKGLITSASNGIVGSLTDVGTDGIVITGGTGAVIGAGTSIAQHVADTTHNGYLSSTDWNTFNSKQAAGNYITALTGDITATGPGSVAATLATVNGNVGSFTYASITVNAKGLITAASSGTAPVTSVSGTAGNISSTGGTTPVLDLVNTAVTPNTYTNATVTVDAKGRITAASSGTAPVTSVSGTTNQINSTGGTTPVLSLSSTLVLPGTMTAGGAIAMASNKITGLAAATANGDAVRFEQVNGQRILQIVQATSTTSFSTTSSTFQTTNLSASITPASTSSKIFIIASGDIEETDVAGNILTSLFRDSTNLGNAINGFHLSQTPTNTRMPITLSYLDSPATVSAITYSVKLKNDNGTTTVRFGISGGNSTQVITLVEVG